jgi:hypothetical protein
MRSGGVEATEGEGVAVAFTAAVEGSVAAATAAAAATAERAITVAAIVVDTDIAGGMATEADTTAAGAAVMVMAGGVTGGVDIGATQVTGGVGRIGDGDSDGDIPITIMVITATPATILTTTVRRAIHVPIMETMEATRLHHLRTPTPTAARIGLRIQEFIPEDLQLLPTRKDLRRTILITTVRLMTHGRLLFPSIT